MMYDFCEISPYEVTKRGKIEIIVEPEFLVNTNTTDLMRRGGDFYAVWNEDTGLWSTSEQTVIDNVDREIRNVASKCKHDESHKVVMRLMVKSSSGSITRWHKFIQKDMRDKFETLDQKLIFSNTETKKEDFASKKLSYPLQEGDISAYDEIMNALYAPDEREKIEWVIGAIVSGDSKHIQKFLVLYGPAGTGKSTVINIINNLFKGYTSTFNSKELASANSPFSLESFKNHPLVSIQHEGNLSKIEDNTKLNSLVAHEPIEVNAKYEKLYVARFNTFLIMATNNPVKITDAKSGIIRRLIDVKPTGNKLPFKKYTSLMKQVEFELGGIAWHCLQVYEKLGENYYDSYIPTDMMAATNDFYDFIDYVYEDFKRDDKVTLAEAWSRYKDYCDFAKITPMKYRIMRSELMNYFKDFKERAEIDGIRVRNLYSGFLADKFKNMDLHTGIADQEEEDDGSSWLDMKEQTSLLDDFLASVPAQYAREDGGPMGAWKYVKTKLSDIDTSKTHYVNIPAEWSLIVPDFDIRDKDGNKDLEANKKAASSWPKTYAEVSKSGGGIHLHYIYDGDASKLRSWFGQGIEIKVFPGDAALRRKLSLCNDIPIAHLNSGLPLKGEAKKLVDWKGVENQEKLRAMVLKNLRKGYHKDTSSSINYIYKLTEEAYNSGISYNISDLEKPILDFALGSTNQKERCVNLVGRMHLMSDDTVAPVPVIVDPPEDDDERPLIFLDVEVYKNFNCIVWKKHHVDTLVKIPFPKAWDVEQILKLYRMIGFNCREYDNHILHLMMMGKNPMGIYEGSQNIIAGVRGAKYGVAYNYSYTDVFDFCTEKMSLKKWEIKLGEFHQEMDIPWDQEVPEEDFERVMEYCGHDVRATEAVFDARQGDFKARKIQVALVRLLHGDEIKVTVNDTTNTLSKRIIFGMNKEPQNEFNYRDMSKPVGSDQYEYYVERFGSDYKFRVFGPDGLPQYRDYVPGEVLPEGWSILPFFPGYTCVMDEKTKKYVSTYMGETIGEGGRVYSVPGYYSWVWDGDVSSQHPHSIMAEVLFGPRYTKIFAEIVEARVAIKHKDFETAGKLLGGALKPYLTEDDAKDLAQALKIVINSIYGLTKASFKNEFRDPRNFDNIVAKRGALFMTLLKHEVEKLGYLVCHIKTDSIKIPGADDFIKDFVIKFGHEYGYDFETEGVFSKFCLVNDAAYVAFDIDEQKWITKADQFKEEKQPYMFKTLFSHNPVVFDDLCETKSVTKGALYLDLNEDLGEPVDDELAKEEKKLDRMLNKLDKKLREENPGISDNWVTRKLYDYDTCEFPEVKAQFDIVKKLREEAPKHHNLKFVGRVGQFTPVIDGVGGGNLYRVDGDTRAFATGSSGYKWLESWYVKKYGLEDKVDMRYYDEIVSGVIDTISKYVNFDWFIGDEAPEFKVYRKEPLPDFMNIPENAKEEYEWPK